MNHAKITTLAATNPASYGWLSKMYDLGFKATFRFGPFGSTIYTVKLKDEHITFKVQATFQTNLSIENPTPVQLEILDSLKATGVCSYSLEENELIAA